MFYYTYVLRSERDGRLYIGCTSNLKVRVREHQGGLVQATKHRLPVQLVYYEACKSKSSAYAREQYFKTGFGRRYLRDRSGP
ncbi:GIY-YIG nuclease family protein [Candidatus Woesebacteria bacterium]|nr:GIY-YIG nuclease family protein [Candidatus Woesebacteria bacterium]